MIEVKIPTVTVKNIYSSRNPININPININQININPFYRRVVMDLMSV
jgi:hypothetical protein